MRSERIIAFSTPSSNGPDLVKNAFLRPGPRMFCGTPDCGGLALFAGYCEHCFEWYSSRDFEANWRADRRARRRARLARFFHWLRSTGVYIAAVIAVEWMLVWEFRSFFIELGEMWIGGRK